MFLQSEDSEVTDFGKFSAFSGRLHSRFIFFLEELLLQQLTYFFWKDPDRKHCRLHGLDGLLQLFSPFGSVRKLFIIRSGQCASSWMKLSQQTTITKAHDDPQLSLTARSGGMQDLVLMPRSLCSFPCVLALPCPVGHPVISHVYLPIH